MKMEWPRFDVINRLEVNSDTQTACEIRTARIRDGINNARWTEGRDYSRQNGLRSYLDGDIGEAIELWGSVAH